VTSGTGSIAGLTVETICTSSRRCVGGTNRSGRISVALRDTRARKHIPIVDTYARRRNRAAASAADTTETGGTTDCAHLVQQQIGTVGNSIHSCDVSRICVALLNTRARKGRI
jgi:hypothetical protein